MAAPTPNNSAVKDQRPAILIEPIVAAAAAQQKALPPAPQERSWRDAAKGFLSTAGTVLQGAVVVAKTMKDDFGRLGNAFVAKVVTDALDKFLEPANKERAHSQKVIAGVEDRDLLVTVINGVVPEIATFLSTKNPALAAIYKGNDQAMYYGVQTLLFNACARLIEASPMPTLKPGEKVAKKSFFSVLAFALGLLEKQYEIIKPRLEAAGKDNKARNKILEELMVPVLAVAFPKGKESLGLNSDALYADAFYKQFLGSVSITDEAWDALRTHLPVLVVDILNVASERSNQQTEAVGKLPNGKMELIAIKSLTPWIVSLAAQHQEIANAFNTHCPKLFSKAIEFALTLFGATAAQRTKKGAASTTDSLAYVAGEVQRQFRMHELDIADSEQLVKAGDAESFTARNHLLTKLFVPLVQMADPSATNVPVTDDTPAAVVILQALVRKTWGAISPMLPTIGVKVYDLCMDSHTAVALRDEVLQKDEEGLAVSNVAALVANVVVTKVKAHPKVPKKAAEMVVVRLPDFTEQMAKGEWEQDRVAFGNFVQQLAGSVLASKARGLAPLVPLMQRRMTEMTTKVFYYMAARELFVRKRQGIDEPADVITLITAQFRKLFTVFYLKHCIELRDEYDKISALPPEDSRRVQWINRIFQPFSAQLLEITGLSKEPLFGLQDSIRANLPNWLFDIYGSLIKSESNLLLWVNPLAAVAVKKLQMSRMPLGKFWIQVAERAADGILSRMPAFLNGSLAQDIAFASTSKCCETVNRFHVGVIVDEAMQKLQQMAPDWHATLTPSKQEDLQKALTEDCVKWLGKRVHKSDYSTSMIMSATTQKLLPSTHHRGYSVFLAWFNPKLEAAVVSHLTPTTHWTKTVNAWLTDSLKSIADHSVISLAQRAVAELRKTTENEMNVWFDALPEATLQQIETSIVMNVKMWLVQRPQASTQELVRTIYGTINRISNGEFAQKLPSSNPNEWNWKWLEERVTELSTRYSHVEPLWDFARAHLIGILLNSLARPNIGGIVAQCATKAHGFIQENGEKIEVQYIEVAKCNRRILDLDTQLIRLDSAHPSDDVVKERLELNAQKKRVLAQRETHIAELTPTFQKLASDILTLFGIDQDPKLKVFGGYGLIVEKAAKVICLTYVEMMLPSEGYEVTFDRLCNMFFDQRLFQQRLLAQGITQDLVQLMSDPSTMPAEKRIELWKVSEAAIMAKQVENVIRGFAAPYLRKFLQFFAKRYDMQEWLKVSYDIEVSPYEAKLLRQEMQKFADHKAIGDYLEQLINTSLPLAIINTISAIQKKQSGQQDKELRHHLYSTPYLMLKTVLTIMDKHLAEVNDRPNLEQRITEAEKEPNPTTRREKLRNIFKPIAKDLLALIGNNLNDPMHPGYHWPLPLSLKTLFWTNLFPNILADMMINGNQSIRWDTRQMRVEQEQLYGSKHPMVVAETAGRFAQNYFPHTLAADAPKRAREISNTVEVLTRGAEEGPGKQFHDYWQSNQQSIEMMVAANSQQIGENREDPFKHAWDWARDKVEAFTMTVIGKKSNNLAAIEKYRKGFMMDMMAKTMKRIAEHAKCVNEITKKAGKSHPHQVDVATMRKGFGKQLHPALRVPEGLSPAEEEKLLAEQKMNLFIKPLTEKLLVLAGVSSEMMPASLFQLLKNTLAPVMCSIVYDSTWSRQTGKNMQITFVTKWREAIRTALQQQATGVAPAPKNNQVDPKDVQHFQSIASPLLKELVEWLPGTLVNILIHNLEGVHQISAEMLTNISVNQAQQLRPIELMRKALIVAGPCMQPAQWNKRQPNAPDELDPKDVLVPSAQIEFPRTEEERSKALAQRVERAHFSENEATSVSVQLGIESINATISTFARNKIWVPITCGMECLAGKVFRSYGMAIAATIKSTLEYIGKLLSYLLYPLHLLLIYPIEWIHIAIQERNLDRSASLPANESLFMDLNELWVDGAVAVMEEMERLPIKEEFKAVLEQITSASERPALRNVAAMKALKAGVPAVSESMAKESVQV